MSGKESAVFFFYRSCHVMHFQSQMTNCPDLCFLEITAVQQGADVSPFRSGKKKYSKNIPVRKNLRVSSMLVIFSSSFHSRACKPVMWLTRASPLAGRLARDARTCPKSIRTVLARSGRICTDIDVKFKTELSSWRASGKKYMTLHWKNGKHAAVFIFEVKTYSENPFGHTQ